MARHYRAEFICIILNTSQPRGIFTPFWDKPMQLFDGKAHALKLEKKITGFLEMSPPKKELAIIMVGENPASQKYVNLKKNLCEKLGVPVRVYKISADLEDQKIFDEIAETFASPQVGGGIIQLPLPRESLNKALELIPEEKDIDRISPKSQEKFYSGDFSKLPPTVRAFDYFLTNSNIDPNNLDTIIVGQGFLVGRPLGHYLAQRGTKAQFILDYKTNQPLNCHLLVLSAGSPELVRGESILKRCHVVDFGSSVKNGNTIGDLDLKSRIGHLGIVSPSPGGMGPLVTRFLLMNFLGI